MGTVEGGLIAVKDGDEVDNSIVPRNHACQRGFIVDVAFVQADQGQHLQVLGLGQAPGWHGDTRLHARKLFAHVLADKARAA